MDRTRMSSNDKEQSNNKTNLDRPQTQRRMSAARLRNDSINWAVPANEGAREYVKEQHGEESWRNKILHVLHSHKVQYTLMFLLFLDVIVLFVEIFLVGQYPVCHTIERDCLACCPMVAGLKNNGTDERFLSGGGSDEPICEAGYTNESGYGSCNEDKWHGVHVAEQVLFAFTITILITFTIEINVEMIALGPSVFFRQLFYLFDYVIIVVSTTMELVFFLQKNELALSGATGFIIFVRLWRFIRIGHGIVEVTSEYTHQSYEDLQNYAETLETELRKHSIPLPDPPKSLHRQQSSGGTDDDVADHVPDRFPDQPASS